MIYNFLFNSISVITGGWEGDNDRLCAVESCLWNDFYLGESILGPLDQRGKVAEEFFLIFLPL